MAVTSIEWTATVSPDGSVRPGYTFNPWIGCTKVAAGCKSCYAESLAKRTGLAKWGEHGTRVKTSENYWRKPIKWNRDAEKAGERHRVFCASLADVFDEWGGNVAHHSGDKLLCCDNCGAFRRDDDSAALESCECSRFWPRTEWANLTDVRRALFALIDATPHLDWLVLTKRPENIRRMWPAFASEVQPNDHFRHNVWLGTSIATQEDADANIPPLLACRDLAPVLFLSAEPLLGPVDISQWLPAADGTRTVDGEGDDLPTVGWLIAGGESGHGARSCDLAWVRGLRKQCSSAGVPCFVKQLGSKPVQWSPYADGLGGVTGGGGMESCRGEDPKGGNWDEWPEDLRVREYPQVEATP